MQMARRLSAFSYQAEVPIRVLGLLSHEGRYRNSVIPPVSIWFSIAIQQKPELLVAFTD
jgi:hypothetical protein